MRQRRVKVERPETDERWMVVLRERTEDGRRIALVAPLSVPVDSDCVVLEGPWWLEERASESDNLKGGWVASPSSYVEIPTTEIETVRRYVGGKLVYSRVF